MRLKLPEPSWKSALGCRLGSREIKRRAVLRLEKQPELLSLHYLQSQRFAEAWEFSLAAADRATAVYANTDAAEFYERALAAGRRLPDRPPPRRW